MFVHMDYREKTHDRARSVAYAHSFGEGGSGGSAPYFLASAFDQVGLLVEMSLLSNLHISVRHFVLVRCHAGCIPDNAHASLLLAG
jgi:hypothetical protein